LTQANIQYNSNKLKEKDKLNHSFTFTKTNGMWDVLTKAGTV